MEVIRRNRIIKPRLNIHSELLFRFKLSEFLTVMDHDSWFVSKKLRDKVGHFYVKHIGCTEINRSLILVILPVHFRFTKYRKFSFRFSTTPPEFADQNFRTSVGGSFSDTIEF